MPEFPHRHIEVPANPQRLKFKGSGRGKFKLHPRTREQHAARLQRQLSDISSSFDEALRDRVEEEIADDFGLILNVQSAPGYPLKFDSLERAPSKKAEGIYLLNVRTKEIDGELVTSAAILVPYGKLDMLAKKVADYANPEKDRTQPANSELLANIESISVAALEALWTEPEALPTSDEPLWWELWVSRAPRPLMKEQTWAVKFEIVRQSLGLQANLFRLRLPDNEIVLVKARRSELEGSLDLLNTLTEVRKVRPCSLDLTDLPGPEQSEWIDEALHRIQFPDNSAPAVCLLDTGVNRGHPLLQRLLNEEDVDTILPQFGKSDTGVPHGTPMAGLAAYDDLRNLMLSTAAWEQLHRLESIKLIHTGDGDHDPENYGAATEEAITRPETQNPTRKRVYCLAITQPEHPNTGQPSSWSAALDSSASGAEEEGQPRRIILVSAGNNRELEGFDYPETLHRSRIENPAQAWNVITVGANTRRTVITEDDDEAQRSRTIAGHDQLSPFTRTSCDWVPKWPIKPEIVMEGGNLAQNEQGNFHQMESLELVSTATNFRIRPLCSMNATSAATASASRLGAQLLARFPDYWEETQRGLIVNSARWSEASLGGHDPHRMGNTARTQSLLRQYGFGEPYQPRLFGSGSSGVSLIIQDHIQPYDPESKAGSASLGSFNLHQLPWPADLFAEHLDLELKLRVTLSYFIYPNPGSRSNLPSKKYRYASHLLRFKVKNKNESDIAFRKSLEKEIKEDAREELEVEVGTAKPDPQWALGSQLRGKSGSLVQDVWKGSAAQLSEMGQIAIYPVKGWFATRKFPEDHEFHNCHQRPVRYSLIISIDAAQEIGLYNSISNILEVTV